MLGAFFRVADPNPTRSWNAGAIHFDSCQTTIHDHERNSRMRSGANMETILFVLAFRHSELLVQGRIQLREVHSDFDRADSVLTQNP